MSAKTSALLRADAPYRLRAEGFTFTEHNKGAHLIVLSWKGTEMVLTDFWPGTQKWAIRNGEKGVGIDALITKLKGK